MVDQPSDGAVPLDTLLDRVAAGDRAAFARLYRLTSARLFAVCTRILPDRGDAEEALQETFLLVWRRAITFDAARGRPMTWLIALARNCAIDRLRAGRTLAPLPSGFDDVADPAPLASDIVERRDSEARLTICLDRLAQGDSRLIRAAFFEGSTYAELATRAALPLGTVKSRIRRALSTLAACLA